MYLHVKIMKIHHVLLFVTANLSYTHTHTHTHMHAYIHICGHNYKSQAALH